MIRHYIIAENLKHRHSFLKKLPVIAPLVSIVQAFVLMPLYFTINAYNWWYIILMPATFALIPTLMHRREERKLNYRALCSLDISLKKVWVSKMLTALIYMILTAGIHMFGVFIIQFFVGNQLTANYEFSTLLMASVLLVITNIWQIPFCFFLAKKFGGVASIIGNVLLGLLFGILLFDSSMWIFCPYSWGIRLMIPVMKILPNGVPVEGTNPMTINTNLSIPCVMSILLFIFITGITANWFSRLEVK